MVVFGKLVKHWVVTFLTMFSYAFQPCGSWGHLGPELLNQILKKPLDLTSPAVVTFNAKGSFNLEIRLAKALFKTGSVAFIYEHQLANYSMVEADNDSRPEAVLVNVTSDKELNAILDMVDKANLGTRGAVLVMLPNSSWMAKVDPYAGRIRIDQEIFFLAVETLELFEVYSINGQVIKTKVGYYQKFRRKDWLDFKLYNAGWIKNLGDRRQNFFGKHFITITDEDFPYTSLHPGFENNATFFPGTKLKKDI